MGDSIRTLSLSGGYSDSILISFFRKLHDNQSLLELDVSNNKLGDIGASAIASLIRNNSFIASIHCDNNSFNQSGFQAIALSISRSKSLQYFDCQWQDLKNSKGRHRLIRKAIIDIQITLAINRSQYVHPRFESSNSEILPICTRPIPSSTIPPELLEEDELESKPENDTPVFPVDMPQGDTRVISPIHNTHTVPVIAPQAYTSTIPEFGEQGPSFAYTAASKPVGSPPKQTISLDKSPNIPPPPVASISLQKENMSPMPTAPIINNSSSISLDKAPLPPMAPPPAVIPPPPTSKPPSNAPGRSAMLSSITAFNKGKLKKTETKDSSAPKL